jgi:hypothetical protein
MRSNKNTLLLLVFLFQRALAEYRHDEEPEEWKPIVDPVSHSDLFEPCASIQGIAPTRFPKPTRPLGDNVTIIVEPTFGKHRPDVDAILAYAEGYKLSFYMMFMETLTHTGFRGDVVLAIAEERIVRPDVVDYLKTFALGDTDKPSIVVYQQPMKCNAKDGNIKNERQILKSGDTDVFQMCQLEHVYGWKDEMGHVVREADDPREGRVVATIRYEWYWIWSQQYHAHSWLMLLDARDSFFQSNPFAGLPRDTDDSPDGLLYLFGENADATRLGRSTKNMKWIKNGYGDATIDALKDKPTICSGSTMGEQIAIETYLRAMVNEHDECNVRMTGSDQGFHNYIYYSAKLTNADTIRKIVVWEQGRGIINNLGALRTQPLLDWGMYDPKTHAVYQWDGVTKSPVVHQWDRDHDLHGWMFGKQHRLWSKEWAARKEKE